MRLDHLLSRERSGARESEAKPEVGPRRKRAERQAESAGKDSSGEEPRRPGERAGQKELTERRDMKMFHRALEKTFFTISFSGIAKRTLTTAQSKKCNTRKKRAGTRPGDCESRTERADFKRGLQAFGGNRLS